MALEDRRKRVLEVSDKLLDKIQEAVSQLDKQVVKEVTKTKQTCFGSEENPKKPTQETVTEIHSLKQVDSLIDRDGLKQLIAALKDVQEVQLSGEAGGKETGTLSVVLEGELKTYAN